MTTGAPQTQECFTSFMIQVHLGNIVNAGVYFNEDIPTYESGQCMAEREGGGGAVGGSIGGVIAVLICCCIIFMLSSKKKEAPPEPEK